MACSYAQVSVLQQRNALDTPSRFMIPKSNIFAGIFQNRLRF